MKAILLATFSAFGCLIPAMAQDIDPVIWTYSVEKIPSNDTITLRMDASIASNWYLYAEKEDKGELSVSLLVKVLNLKNCRAVGTPIFSGTLPHYVEGLNNTYSVMQDRGSIRQRFVRTSVSGSVNIAIEYTALSEAHLSQEGIVVIKSEKRQVQF